MMKETEMVEHVVLFKLKADATPEQKNAAVEALT